MSFVFCIGIKLWSILRKCELFLFMLKIILLRHKVGLCLHGHILLHFYAGYPIVNDYKYGGTLLEKRYCMYQSLCCREWCLQ